jgi:hypothetical protein
MQKWADMLTNTRNKESWARVFPTGAGLFQALAGRAAQPGVFIWVMTWGAAGDAERGLFADFIEEAAQILNKPKLLPIAGQFRAAAALWRSWPRLRCQIAFLFCARPRRVKISQHVDQKSHY